MLFVIHCIDHQDKGELRLATRAQHLDYVSSSDPIVKAAGPFLADDGTSMIGSMLVIDVTDRAAAEAWATQDPYAKAGLFARVDILAWRWSIGTPAGL